MPGLPLSPGCQTNSNPLRLHGAPPAHPPAGGCVKWTDKWAEREVLGGAREQWGDKWEENFAGGRGTKTVGWPGKGVPSDGRFGRAWGGVGFAAEEQLLGLLPEA